MMFNIQQLTVQQNILWYRQWLKDSK